MNATCSRCGESHAVATYPSINVAADPDLKARVRDGSLFVWECPHCGARNLLKYQTLYHDPAERLMVWLLPGDAEPPQAVADAVKELDGYTLRLVREVGDLVEKVNIHACGLDDVLVEMCKYVTRLEMADQQKRPEIQDAPLKFFKMDGPDNDLLPPGRGDEGRERGLPCIRRRPRNPRAPSGCPSRARFRARGRRLAGTVFPLNTVQAEQQPDFPAELLVRTSQETPARRPFDPGDLAGGGFPFLRPPAVPFPDDQAVI